MSFPDDKEPPTGVRYALDEALDLLGALEDARDALMATDHLAEVSEVEHQIELLDRRLGFDDGGTNG